MTGAAPRRSLLLDYHGVISDGERLPAEWRRLLGDFLTPRFGMSPEVWAEANRHALTRSLARAQATEALPEYEERRRADRIEWLRDMLLFAGLGRPLKLISTRSRSKRSVMSCRGRARPCPVRLSHCVP